MSRLSIEENFALDADPSAVWSFLIDPERVVSCLPGAELTGRADESTYEGQVNVSAGPVTVAYRGTAVFEEVDDGRRYVRIVARGRERTGSGTVSMTMESRVEEADDGGTAVSVKADVKVAGKIVRFGRGMIQSVSTEMFSEFTRRLEDRVGEEAKPGEPATGPAAEAGTGQSVAATEGGDAAGGDEPEGDRRRESPSRDDSLTLLPLLWRSIKRWLGGIFG